MSLYAFGIFGAICGLAGFMAGWLKGRRDFSTDLDDTLGDCLDKLEAIPTHCKECGEGFKAMCPKGHATPTRSQP